MRIVNGVLTAYDVPLGTPKQTRLGPDEYAAAVACPTCHARKNVICRGPATHQSRMGRAMREWDNGTLTNFTPKRSYILALAARDLDLKARRQLAQHIDTQTAAERRAARLAGEPVHRATLHHGADPKPCRECLNDICANETRIVRYNTATHTYLHYHEYCAPRI